jgi:hypothetical protein
MNNSQVAETNERLDLLSEIEQIPEEYIPELLKVVRLFRSERATIGQTSVDSWNNAINQIGNADKNKNKQERIQQLLQFFAELDDENEQKETLKVIESIEGVSI